jgi:hypothetical protein
MERGSQPSCGLRLFWWNREAPSFAGGPHFPIFKEFFTSGVLQINRFWITLLTS